MLVKHCSACGNEPAEYTLAVRFTRLSACCDAAWCNGAGRSRYAYPGAVNPYELGAQFSACCDAVAGARCSSGTPRRVARW